MNLRRALIKYLIGHEITSVYTMPVPPCVKMPYAVLTLVSCVPNQDSLTETDSAEWLWQFDVYARSCEEADTFSDLLIAALNRPGEWPEIGGKKASYCRMDSFSDLTELEQDGSERRTVRYELEFRIII